MLIRWKKDTHEKKIRMDPPMESTFWKHGHVVFLPWEDSGWVSKMDWSYNGVFLEPQDSFEGYFCMTWTCWPHGSGPKSKPWHSKKVSGLSVILGNKTGRCTVKWTVYPGLRILSRTCVRLVSAARLQKHGRWSRTTGKGLGKRLLWPFNTVLQPAVMREIIWNGGNG